MIAHRNVDSFIGCYAGHQIRFSTLVETHKACEASHQHFFGSGLDTGVFGINKEFAERFFQVG